MSSTEGQQQQHSKTSAFIRGAGHVEDKNLWGPAKWVVSMIQTMIALIIITMAEGISKIFTGGGSSRKKTRDDAPKQT